MQLEKESMFFLIVFIVLIFFNPFKDEEEDIRIRVESMLSGKGKLK